MRLISQDGRYDMNYDRVSLSILQIEKQSASVVAYTEEMTPIQFAKYKNVEKAEKAMEMLRNAYAGKFITNADCAEDFDENMKELMKHGFGTVIIKESDTRLEFNNLNGYFQFPADDEIEA